MFYIFQSRIFCEIIFNANKGYKKIPGIIIKYGIHFNINLSIGRIWRGDIFTIFCYTEGIPRIKTRIIKIIAIVIMQPEVFDILDIGVANMLLVFLISLIIHRYSS